MSKPIRKSKDVMKRISRVGAALVVFSLSTVAWAQSDNAQVREMLSRADSSIFMRYPPDSYREKIWEHVAGVMVPLGPHFELKKGMGNPCCLQA